MRKDWCVWQAIIRFRDTKGSLSTDAWNQPLGIQDGERKKGNPFWLAGFEMASVLGDRLVSAPRPALCQARGTEPIQESTAFERPGNDTPADAKSLNSFFFVQVRILRLSLSSRPH